MYGGIARIAQQESFRSVPAVGPLCTSSWLPALPRRDISISEQEAHKALTSRCIDCLVAKSTHPQSRGCAEDKSNLASYANVVEFRVRHAHMAQNDFRIANA